METRDIISDTGTHRSFLKYSGREYGILCRISELQMREIFSVISQIFLTSEMILSNVSNNFGFSSGKCPLSWKALEAPIAAK